MTISADWPGQRTMNIDIITWISVNYVPVHNAGGAGRTSVGKLCHSVLVVLPY